MDSRTDPVWRALRDEAALAAQHLGLGVLALSKANYAQQAYYSEAFFALSVGFERSTKLAIALDHALDHAGTFPDSEFFKQMHHKLDLLLARVDDVAQRRGMTDGYEQFPQNSIHKSIVEVLTSFAKNVTRYYNLEMLNPTNNTPKESPVAEWHRKVTKPVLTQHFSARMKSRVDRNAQIVGALLSGISSVRFQAEDGLLINTADDASGRTGANEVARRWERMYVMQIARFVASVVVHLGQKANAAGMNVPDFAELFPGYLNNDEYFRSRRSWFLPE